MASDSSGRDGPDATGHQAGGGAPDDARDAPSDASDASDAIAIAPDALVTLICRHAGRVSAAELHAAGYNDATIAAWVEEEVLRHDSVDGRYALDSPDVYVDVLIQALWEIPEGIIGHLSTLEYHGMSVAWLWQVDVAVQRSPASTSVRVRPFLVPEHLWRYGVEQIVPSLPGTIAIPMYTPAVAMAQVLRDPDWDVETAADALSGYFGMRGSADAALAEAAARYGVMDQLDLLLRALG
jgi:hypothetical protein